MAVFCQLDPGNSQIMADKRKMFTDGAVSCRILKPLCLLSYCAPIQKSGAKADGWSRWSPFAVLLSGCQNRDLPVILPVSFILRDQIRCIIHGYSSLQIGIQDKYKDHSLWALHHFPLLYNGFWSVWNSHRQGSVFKIFVRRYGILIYFHSAIFHMILDEIFNLPPAVTVLYFVVI